MTTLQDASYCKSKGKYKIYVIWESLCNKTMYSLISVVKAYPFKYVVRAFVFIDPNQESRTTNGYIHIATSPRTIAHPNNVNKYAKLTHAVTRSIFWTANIQRFVRFILRQNDVHIKTRFSTMCVFRRVPKFYLLPAHRKLHNFSNSYLYTFNNYWHIFLHEKHWLHTHMQSMILVC